MRKSDFQVFCISVLAGLCLVCIGAEAKSVSKDVRTLVCEAKLNKSFASTKFAYIYDSELVENGKSEGFYSYISFSTDKANKKETFGAFMSIGNGGMDDPQLSRDTEPGSHNGWGGFASYDQDSDYNYKGKGAILLSKKEQVNQKRRSYKVSILKRDPSEDKPTELTAGTLDCVTK